ncbi:MAG: tetratricopeptide repeat protein [Phycisphaerae bacterium]
MRCTSVGAVLVALVTVVHTLPVVARPNEDAATDAALRGYLSANGMLNRGLYELAAEEYRRFLSEHGDHDKAPVARYGLGVSLYRMKRYDQAVKALELLKDESDFEFAAEVGTILGQSHLALKQYGPAAEAFDRVVRKHAKHQLADEACAGLAEARYLDGEYDDALAACRRFDEKWSDSPLRDRVIFFAGLSRMAQREYADAAEQFRALLEAFPKGPFAEQSSLLLAQCLEQDNAVKKAIRQYRRAVKRVGDRFLPEALLGLAGLLQRQGESAEAGEYLDRLLEHYSDAPQIASARLLRGRTWFDQQRYDEALAMFSAVDTEDKTLAAEAAYWTAKCVLRKGDHSAAAELLRSAVERFPKNGLAAEMQYDRAIALVRAGDEDEAVDVLDDFRRRFSDHALVPDALRLLAVTEHQRKRYDASRRHCARFLETYGSHPLAASVAFLSAENAFLSGKYEQAVKGYRTFLSRFDTDKQAPQARFRLGTALYRLDRLDEAAEFLASADHGSDTDGAFRPALLALGDIAFRRGQWKSAERHLADYLAGGLDRPAADAALLKLGLSLSRQGRPDEALNAYDRLIHRFEKSVHRVQAMFERGQALVALNRTDDAVAAFETLLSEAAESRFTPYALNHLAAIATQRQQFEKAAGYYARVAKAAPEESMTTEALLQDARALMAANQYHEAQKAFERFLDDHRSHAAAPEAAARRAVALARQNKHKEAVKAIERVQRDSASSLDPKLAASLRYEKAWCLRELGRTDDAAKEYRRLLDDDDATGDLGVHALLDLSGILIADGRFDQAHTVLAKLRDAIAEEPADVPAAVRERAAYRLGICAFELKQFEEAAGQLAEFVDTFPESALLASAAYHCGESFFRLGRHDEAVKQLTRVTESCQEDAVYGPALLRLGESLAARQRWARSEGVFTTYLDRFGDSDQWFQARFGIGWAQEHQQRHAEAISTYQTIVTRHQGPTAARAQFQIGECLFAQKQYDKAVRELLKVDILYAYPEWSAAALFEAGRCFEQLGKSVEARDQFRRVIKDYKESRWAGLASQRLSAMSDAMLPGR